MDKRVKLLSNHVDLIKRKIETSNSELQRRQLEQKIDVLMSYADLLHTSIDDSEAKDDTENYVYIPMITKEDKYEIFQIFLNARTIKRPSIFHVKFEDFIYRFKYFIAPL